MSNKKRIKTSHGLGSDILQYPLLRNSFSGIPAVHISIYIFRKLLLDQHDSLGAHLEKMTPPKLFC